MASGLSVSPPMSVVAVVVISLATTAWLRQRTTDNFLAVRSVTIALRNLEPLAFREAGQLIVREASLEISQPGEIAYTMNDRPTGSSRRGRVVQYRTVIDAAGARQIFATLKPLYPLTIPSSDDRALAAAISGKGGYSRDGRIIHRCKRQETDVRGDGVEFHLPGNSEDRVTIAPSWCTDAFTQSTKRRIEDARRDALAALHSGPRHP